MELINSISSTINVIYEGVGTEKIVELEYIIHERELNSLSVYYPNKSGYSTYHKAYEIEIVALKTGKEKPKFAQNCAAYCSIKKGNDKKDYLVFGNEPIYGSTIANGVLNYFVACVAGNIVTNGETFLPDNGLSEFKERLEAKFRFTVEQKNWYINIFKKIRGFLGFFVILLVPFLGRNCKLYYKMIIQLYPIIFLYLSFSLSKSPLI